MVAFRRPSTSVGIPLGRSNWHRFQTNATPDATVTNSCYFSIARPVPLLPPSRCICIPSSKLYLKRCQSAPNWWHVFGPNVRGRPCFTKSYVKIECKNVHFQRLFGSERVKDTQLVENCAKKGFFSVKIFTSCMTLKRLSDWRAVIPPFRMNVSVTCLVTCLMAIWGS
jgi:hypothetical protein